MISFGLIGYGKIGERHAEHISTHPEAQLIGVFDIKADRLNFFRNAYRDLRTYDSIKGILHDPEIGRRGHHRQWLGHPGAGRIPPAQRPGAARAIRARRRGAGRPPGWTRATEPLARHLAARHGWHGQTRNLPTVLAEPTGFRPPPVGGIATRDYE